MRRPSRRLVVSWILASALLVSAVPAAADEYDPRRAGHPLRIIAYVLHPVGVAFDTPGYGTTGDVAFWDVGTLTMGLTEPPDWTQAPLFLTLIRDDGTTTEPVEVTAGAEPNEVVLPEAPDFDLVLDDGTRERPKYVLGATDIVRPYAG